MRVQSPRDRALEAHKDYYQHGHYPLDRYRWTIETFIPNCSGKRILEVGCGDGGVIQLLRPLNNEVFGVDISETAIARCQEKGIKAFLLDVSSEPLPFEDDFFDVVICLETLEHLTNPYYALMEMRRVLKNKGKLICSVPNPWTGHPYLYPGLFEFKYFRKFLLQCGFQITRVEPWEWAPRETILPDPLRRFKLLRSRYVAGVLRRIVERAYRALGIFPYFCYWLWTFECINEDKSQPTPLERQADITKPKGGSEHD
ncbi:MAG: class I SAM-dependent methyltransferase [Thermoproteota archaeon]